MTPTPTMPHRVALALTLGAMRALLREAAALQPITRPMSAAIQGARQAEADAARSLAEILPSDELPPLPPASFALDRHAGLMGGGSISAGTYFRDYSMRRYGTECRQSVGSLDPLHSLIVAAAVDMTNAALEADRLLAGAPGTDEAMAASAAAMRTVQARREAAIVRLMGAVTAMQQLQAAPAPASATEGAPA